MWGWGKGDSIVKQNRTNQNPPFSHANIYFPANPYFCFDGIMGKLCKKISDRRGSHSGRNFFRTHCLFLGSPFSGKLNSTGARHPEESVPRHIPKRPLRDTAPSCFQKRTYTFRSNASWDSSLSHFLFLRIMRPQHSGEHKTPQHSSNRAEFPEPALSEPEVC